jgi:hypothetical protein
MATAWQLPGNGVAARWASRHKHGSGMAMAWQWHGQGRAEAWQWHGHGMALPMAWQWHGNGMAMAWQRTRMQPLTVTVHHITLQYITVHYITLHYITSQRHIPVYITSVHYCNITLHYYITLHYFTYFAI